MVRTDLQSTQMVSLTLCFLLAVSSSCYGARLGELGGSQQHIRGNHRMSGAVLKRGREWEFVESADSDDFADFFYNMDWYQKQQTNETELVMDWLERQDAWAQSQVAAHPTDKIWSTVGLVLHQLQGLLDGYNSRVRQDARLAGLPPLTRRQLLYLQAQGDLFEIIHKLAPGARPDWSSMAPRELAARLADAGHCSVIIKVTGDLSDLLLGHDSWFTYASMNRIYKHYDFALQGVGAASRKSSFSSYPGLLVSFDDWYILGSGLVVTETTNALHNATLFELITPASLLYWQRILLANMLADSGEEWIDYMAAYNSGTYANQWMVVDMKRFTPGKALQPGLLWVAEQIPGLVVSEDRTQDLERGYWPSYNVPFFPQIYEKAGYKAFVEEHSRRGPEYASAVAGASYQLAPRANIFRRDAGSVRDLDSLKALLRSNRFQNDSYSHGDPWSAICSRGDLDADHPRASGCTDTKVTSWAMALKMQAHAIASPTTQGQAPFSWSGNEQLSTVAHRGQPDTFEGFEFELQEP